MLRLGLLSFALVGMADEAWACGGFFCDPGPTSTTVINQNAERILFVRDTEANQVSAHIQIRYDGPPEGAVDLAWIVPVVSRPQIDLGEPEIFDDLDRATAPQFIFPPPAGGGSPSSGGGGFGCGGSAGRSAEAAGSDGGDADADADGVQVWGQQNVGSYGTAIVTADDPADLTRWLDLNRYTIPPEAEPIIAEYVAEGSFFVAIRLLSDANLDLLEPVVITYTGDEPCVPLRLTQIASNPTLGVLVWIVAEDQAFPYNYARALVNDEDVVLGSDGTTNYLSLLTTAVDSVGGRAFVTEFAGETSAVVPRLGYYGTTTAGEIISRGRYITRLYTEIDLQDMTVDPIFAFDADLADVSNVHDFTQDVASLESPKSETRHATVASSLAPLLLALGLLWRRGSLS